MTLEIKESESLVPITPPEPSPELLQAIMDFAYAVVDLHEKLVTMVEKGKKEGFEGKILAALVRPILKQMGLNKDKVSYYCKQIEHFTSRNSENPNIDTNNLLVDNVGLYYGDFRDYPTEKIANSIPLIFTDPPYGGESIELYQDLGTFAQKVLADGGSLVTYVGQFTLRECLNVLSDSGLKYWWQLIVEFGGNTYFPFNRHIACRYKPLLWFVKGDDLRGDFEMIFDVIKSDKPDKSQHEWAQSPIEAQEIIRHLTYEKEIILDPFMGTGTTGKAALELQRKFIGFESDAEHFSNARASFERYRT